MFYGGVPINKDISLLKTNCPDVVVGTPGRVLDLIRKKVLNLTYLKHFILDECDTMLDQLGKNNSYILKKKCIFFKITNKAAVSFCFTEP